MILAVDIGNTNIVLSAIDENSILFSSRIYSEVRMMEDQFTVLIKDLLRLYEKKATEFEGAIISSVVPQLTPMLFRAVSKIISGKIIVVGPGVKTGLDIKIDSPSELGADFVCSSVAAKENYTLPCIVIDMGTATKISIVDRSGTFVGGAIIPGMKVSTDALSRSAAQLPNISFENPGKVIGKNTIDCMRSGIVYGTASMLDGMIERYTRELCENCTVILTGGLSKTIAEHLKGTVILDESLILKGLYSIYNRNK